MASLLSLGEWTETAFFALAKGFLGISFSLSQRNSCPHLLQFTIEPSAEEGTLICRLHCGQFRFTGLQYARFSFFCNTCLPNFPLTMYPAKICKKLPSAPISIISPFHFDSLIFSECKNSLKPLSLKITFNRKPFRKLRKQGKGKIPIFPWRKAGNFSVSLIRGSISKRTLI